MPLSGALSGVRYAGAHAATSSSANAAHSADDAPSAHPRQSAIINGVAAPNHASAWQPCHLAHNRAKQHRIHAANAPSPPPNLASGSAHSAPIGEGLALINSRAQPRHNMLKSANMQNQPENKAPVGTAARLKQVQQTVRQAALKAERKPADICTIAISKTQPAAPIKNLLQAGQRDFGENRVQEAQQKWPPLKAAHPACRLHLVGALQSNKAAAAVELFDVIHSLDRPRLAQVLAKLRDAGAVLPQLFVQVNSGGEAQKSGVLPQNLAAFLGQCTNEFKLDIDGLMCLPPQGEPPAPHFAVLNKLAAEHNVPHLSMGMSADFPAAIARGATHIRLGRAIFGPRPIKKGD